MSSETHITNNTSQITSFVQFVFFGSITVVNSSFDLIVLEW